MPDTYRPHLDSDEFGEWGDLLELLQSRPTWHRDASSLKAPLTVSWFPTKKDNGRKAKAICQTCPSLEACRAWSLEQPADLDGIWAGMDRRERAAVRSGKRAA